MVEARKPFGLTESDVRSARQEVYEEYMEAVRGRRYFPDITRDMRGRQLEVLMSQDDPQSILIDVEKINDRLKELRDASTKDIGEIILDEFPDVQAYHPLLEKTAQGRELNTLVSVVSIARARRAFSR